MPGAAPLLTIAVDARSGVFTLPEVDDPRVEVVLAVDEPDLVSAVPLDPQLPPHNIDTCTAGGPRKVFVPSRHDLGAAAGILLGAARGEWFWFVSQGARPTPDAAHEVLLGVDGADEGIFIGCLLVEEEARGPFVAPIAAPGTYSPGRLQELWGHPDLVPPFPMATVVMRSDLLRRTGGPAAGGAPLLAATMRAQTQASTKVVRNVLATWRRQNSTWSRGWATTEVDQRLAAFQASEDVRLWGQRHGWVSAITRTFDPAPDARWRDEDPEPVEPSCRMGPVLSVVTPSIGRSGDYLAELAECVLDGRGIDPELVEWVIVDDCAEKPVRKLLPASVLSDDRVHVLRQAASTGAATARNRALRAATGRFVLPADDDDLIAEGAFAALLEHVDAPDCGWVAGSTTSLLPPTDDDPGPRLGVQRPPRRLSGPVPRHGVAVAWAHPAQIFPIVHCSTIVRRELLLAAGGWSGLPQGEDMAMLLAVTAMSSGYAVDAPVCIYRSHDEQMTSTDTFRTMEQSARVAGWKTAVDLARPDAEAGNPVARLVLDADVQTPGRASGWFL